MSTREQAGIGSFLPMRRRARFASHLDTLNERPDRALPIVRMVGG